MLFSNLVSHTIYRGVDWRVEKAYEYILAGNGLFKRAHSPLISACVPIFHHPIAGLPPLAPAITVHPGRISGRLLDYIYRDARDEAEKDLEKMYQLHLVEGAHGPCWRVTVPMQHISPARIVYQPVENAGVICELHSHHQMSVFFSDIDTRDEQGFRFYAVIGHLLDRPSIALRLGLYGDFVPLPATTLFTDSGPFEDRLEGCAHADDIE